jgi:putative ABC transport system permease protein
LGANALQIDIIDLFLNPPPELIDAFFSYVVGLILVVIIILLSKWQGIGIGDKLLIGTIRGTIQIILMALALEIIFELEDMLLIFGLLTIMSIFAAHTASSNLDEIPGVFKATLPGITIGSLFVMFLCLILGIVEPVGEFIIPMGGMVIGNAMGLSSLALERMWSNAQKQRELLETALALGASAYQALDITIKESMKAGLLPNLNRYAALGIVTIPGLMSGMIIGGMLPVVAALYQVIVFPMIFLGSIINALISSRIFLRQMFNDRLQIMVPPLGEQV